MFRIVTEKWPELARSVLQSGPELAILEKRSTRVRARRQAFPPPPQEPLNPDEEKRLLQLREDRSHLQKMTDTSRQMLRQSLVDGALHAWILTGSGQMIQVPPEPWRTNKGLDAFIWGRIGWLTGFGFEVRGSVFIAEADLLRWLTPNTDTESATIAAETRLTRWLVPLLQAAPDAPLSKAEIREQAAVEAGIQVTDRGFERAWSAAVKQAGAPNWSKGGRKSRQKSPREIAADD